MERKNYYDIAKFIAILSVIIYHVENYLIDNQIIYSFINTYFLSLYLEPHNNQKQSEISKRKSLITNTFYKLTLFGCFLSLPKFPHIFDTYF